MSNTSAPSCILCGCTDSHPTATASYFLQSTTKEDDIRHINQEIHHLDHLFWTKRASLLNRLNEIQSYTYTIPPEILSRIMEIVSNMPPLYEYEWEILKPRPGKRIFTFIPLVLSAVSSHWRQVARSTPRIWTSLRLELENFYVSPPVWENNTIALLSYYFERAKNLSLSLALGAFHDRTIGEENFKVFNIAFRDNATRIKELRLYNPTTMLLEMACGNGNTFPQLQVLEIVSTREPEDEMIPSTSFALPNALALETLSLKYITTLTDLSTTKITHLQLYEIPCDKCIQMLLQCRESIVEFICTFPAPPHFENWLYNDQAYTVPHLEILGWECNGGYSFDDDSFWDKIILQRLDLPSLRELTLLKIPLHLIQGTQPNLFKNAPSTLSTVYIHTNTDFFREEDLRRSLDNIQTLAELYVNSSTMNIFSAVQALTPSCHPRKKFLIPNLKVLCLLGDIPLPGWIPQYDWVSLLRDDEQVPGNTMWSALLQMLSERLPCTEETIEALKEPFVLSFPYTLSGSPEYMAYKEKLDPFIDAGVLQFKNCTRPGMDSTYYHYYS